MGDKNAAFAAALAEMLPRWETGTSSSPAAVYSSNPDTSCLVAMVYNSAREVWLTNARSGNYGMMYRNGPPHEIACRMTDDQCRQWVAVWALIYD